MPGLAAAHTSFARRYIVTATRHHKMAETSGGALWSNHRHEAFPTLAILTSYHLLSVDLLAQHLADREGGRLSPYTGRTFPFLERGGCFSAAE